MSFAALEDKAEFEYLNGLPTSFVLPDEAVDRLRAAAATIITASPEFQRLVKEVGATIVTGAGTDRDNAHPGAAGRPVTRPAK